MTITIFILTLLIGMFAGSTLVLTIAHLFDNYKVAETRRRAIALSAYLNEFPNCTPRMAYETLEFMNFDMHN